LEALPHLGFKPDILHCHDFHCGLIPALLKDGRYRHLWPIKTLFTIHNFEYQGRSLPEVISVAGLDIDSLPSLMRDASDGDINFMVQGIINSDSVSTVSPSYAKEMATPEFAAGLYSITRAYRRKISGILNGIDIEAFNPETDGDIKSNYSPLDPSGKAVNKEYLQKRVGLPRNPNMPLVGFISRLYEQKGIGLLGDWLSKLDAQFIFLGEGDEGCEEKLLSLSARHPGKIAAIIGFDQALAKQIYAGADIFLMPSKFEPCGLGQMIAARYGTIPLVRRVGGLRDSVDAGIGFSFKGFSEKELVSCLKEAISVYRNNYKKWLKLINNCFKKDFSWKRSAEKYIKLYESLLK